jgi:acetylornithine/N-succinyldiaminopimelate aminotransferase
MDIMQSLPSALQTTYAPYPIVMERARGDQVWADDGAAYFDFYGGHCVASTGHSHPAVVQAIAAQAEKFLFYSTAGALKIREQAANALIEFAAGSGMRKVFFCNSGAEANENALKLALMLTGRKKWLCFDGGWHGRSLSCLAVTDDPSITAAYAASLLEVIRLPFNDMRALQSVDWSQIAGCIVEPIQSIAGIRVADSPWLDALHVFCKKNGTLLILDEIQTGVGRMGRPYAADHFALQPDIITSAKGLASGVPIGAMLMRESVAKQLKPADLGSTFGGGPLACAALLATLKVIENEQLMQRALAASERIRAICRGTVVRAVRGVGLLLGLCVPGKAAALKTHLFDQRIMVGGSHDTDVLRLMPPLNISDAAMDALAAALKTFGDQP